MPQPEALSEMLAEKWLRNSAEILRLGLSTDFESPNVLSDSNVNSGTVLSLCNALTCFEAEDDIQTEPVSTFIESAATVQRTLASPFESSFTLSPRECLRECGLSSWKESGQRG